MGNRRFSPRGGAPEPTGHRHLRLQGLLAEELSSLLRDDVDDPAVAGLTVVAVVLSVDYRSARVHIGRSDPSDRRPPGPLEAGLLRATPLLRALLGDALPLPRVPDLRFVIEPIHG